MDDSDDSAAASAGTHESQQQGTGGDGSMDTEGSSSAPPSASASFRSNGDVRKVLTAVNMFVAQTTEFLNGFTQRCDDKLGALQHKIKGVEAELLLLEARLDSIDGLESRPRTLQNHQPIFPVEVKQERENIQESVANKKHSDMNGNHEEVKEVGAVDQGMDVDEKEADACDNRYEEVVGKHAPELRKYFKLLKMGMPVDQIRSKIQVDASAAGFDPNCIISDLEHLDGSVQSAGPDVQGTTETEEVDPSMAVYMRMLKMGVPKTSVKQKMQMDGISDFSILEA